MSNKNKKIIDLCEPVDHGKMMGILNDFAEKYDFLSINSLGKSIFRRNIYKYV